MREWGVTEEERARLLPALTAGDLDGSVSDEDIEGYRERGQITSAEAAYYKGLDKKFTAEQKDFAKRQGNKLKNDIGKIFGLEYKGKADAKSNAGVLFDEKLADIDENSKTYRADVLNARKEALVEAIEEAGHSLRKYTGTYTPFGFRNAQVAEALDAAFDSVTEYRPETYDSLSGEKKSGPWLEDEEKTRREKDWNDNLISDMWDYLGPGTQATAR
jgi:hypothetical protein